MPQPPSDDSAASSRHSKESSLSEKLASRNPYRGNSTTTSNKTPNRKRLSLTSQTSNSTAGSSSATPASSDPLMGTSNHNNHHHFHQEDEARSVSTTDSSSLQQRQHLHDRNVIKRHRRRRLSAPTQEQEEASFSKNNHNHNNAIFNNKSHEDDNKSNSNSHNSHKSLSNLLDQEWEQKVRERASPSGSRSRNSVGSRSRGSNANKSQQSNNKSKSKGKSQPRKVERNSSSSKLDNEVRGRMRKEATQVVEKDNGHKSQSKSPKRLSSSSPIKRSKKQSTSTGTTTTTTTSTQKSRSREQNDSNNDSHNNNNSLSSFIEKETALLPRQGEEALEVQSAFTSASRSRNQKKRSTTLRDKHHHRKRDGTTSMGLGSSFHEYSTRRNSSGMEHSTMARAQRFTSTTTNITAATSRGQPEAMPKRRSRSSSQTRTSSRHDGVASGGTSKSASGSVVQAEEPDGYHTAPLHQRSLSENLQSTHIPSTSGGGGREERFSYHQQGLSSLPVLPEESKKSKKPRALTKKSSSSRTLSLSTTAKKNSNGISPQELSDFLEQCNAKRRGSAAGGFILSSPMSGGRSCVSMPAASSSSASGGGERRGRKASLLINKLSSPSNCHKKTASSSSRMSTKHRQQSQRSFQTSLSDPYPKSSNINSAVDGKKSNGPLIEKLAEKIMTSSRNRNRGRDGKRDASQSKTVQEERATPVATDTVPLRPDANENSLSASKHRSRSAINKDSRHRTDSEEANRARSLSRTRHSPQSSPMTPVGSDNKRLLESRRGPQSSSSGAKGPNRRKGFRKLFSIRDIPSGDSHAGLLGEGETETTIATTGDINYGALEQGRLSPPKTPSNHLDVDGGLLTTTPPPPLAPHSPVKNTRHRRKTSDGGRPKSKSPKRGHRFLTDSTANASGEHEGYHAVKRQSSHRMTAASSKQHHDQRLTSSTASLENKAENYSQAPGDDPEEREALRQRGLYLELQLRNAQQEDDSQSSIGEDVFSHYIWSSPSSVPRREPYEIRREREWLKDSIRKTVLYKAFESIDGAR